MSKVLVWLLERVEEPSTWAGGSIIALALHTALPVYAGPLLALGAAFGGVLAVLIPEVGAKKKPEKPVNSDDPTGEFGKET